MNTFEDIRLKTIQIRSIKLELLDIQLLHLQVSSNITLHEQVFTTFNH